MSADLPLCPQCNRSDRVVATAAKDWFKCQRGGSCGPFSKDDKASARKREKLLREMRARERLKGNR